jgi:hypothetical protein
LRSSEHKDFCKCFQQCRICWTHCIESHGNYFKEDSMGHRINILITEKKIQRGSYLITPCIINVIFIIKK